MHANAVQRRGTDFLQSSSTNCQVVGSGGRGGHLGCHNPATLNTGFGGLADGAPTSTPSAIHAEHGLLLVLLLLFLPEDVVHAVCVHAVLHSLCILCWQPRACVHHVSLGTHSHHVASGRGARRQPHDCCALLGGTGICGCCSGALAHLLQSLGLAMLVDLVDDALDGGEVGLCRQGYASAPCDRNH